ncbi:hypothetical protein MY04_1700 [Flammeovirga sp. MY04]|uniref:hypothetical protein n=1 Tax=Flammeovirga sp. MY04 TaxID=1191459 RepID=UPI0013052F10|nr:hypothetical protein [Flammeovirga sp. MY04]ANQ49074.2 hypothetical protein MY04_1700 [Flammeovirga sp. MY04]
MSLINLGMYDITIFQKLFQFIEDQKFNYSIELYDEISPYPFIKIDDKSLFIHLIEPDLVHKEWHASSSSIIEVGKYLHPNKVIHLWSDTFEFRTEACLSRIAASLGKSKVIYGRKVKVAKITKPELDDFLSINHTGKITNAKIKYGLFLNKALIGVASFSGKRKMTKTNIGHESYEMIRYCNKNGITIMGGLSKVLKQFVIDYSPDDIMTYTENDWSFGDSFSQIGFKKIMNNHSVIFIWNQTTKSRKLLPYNQTINDLKEDEIILYNSGSSKFIFNFNSINV